MKYEFVFRSTGGLAGIDVVGCDRCLAKRVLRPAGQGEAAQAGQQRPAGECPAALPGVIDLCARGRGPMCLRWNSI